MSSPNASLWRNEPTKHHVESIVNRRNIPPIVVKTQTPLGMYLSNVSLDRTPQWLKASSVGLEEIRPGEFLVAALREHTEWLEAEGINVIIFNTDSAIGLREETRPSPSTTGGIPWR